MLFAGHMGMGFQLRVQVGLQDRSFHRRSTRNRFGQDLPCLSPTFEVPLMVATDTLKPCSPLRERPPSTGMEVGRVRGSPLFAPVGTDRFEDLTILVVHVMDLT